MAGITLLALCVQAGLLLAIASANPAAVGQTIGEPVLLRYVQDASPAATLCQQHRSPSLNVRRILGPMLHRTSSKASLDAHVATFVARGF